MGAYSSESEIDDLPGSKLTLPSDYQDKKKDTQVAIRLHELGPRLQLRLIKIEEGLCRGNVVFHAHQSKTAKEIKKQLDSLKDKRELKAKRKAIQEENVRKKAEKKGVKDDYAFEKGENGEKVGEGVGDAEANVDEDQQQKSVQFNAGKKRTFGETGIQSRTGSFTRGTSSRGGSKRGAFRGGSEIKR